jgi:hypothetical protein
VFGAEIPVSVGGYTTRIDFILQLQPRAQDLRLLVAECKRVNPAFGQWCFAKGKYCSPNWAAKQIIPELVNLTDKDAPKSAGEGRDNSSECYNIGFVLKSSAKGDPHPVSPGNDALEEASTQVTKGLNGLLETAFKDHRLRESLLRYEAITILPVVFTTAKLWASSADLTASDLSTGEISLSDGEVAQKKWVYYQYPQSPLFKHGLERGSLGHDSFEDIVGRDYVRSVAVVSAPAIPEFLRSGWYRIDQLPPVR